MARHCPSLKTNREHVNVITLVKDIHELSVCDLRFRLSLNPIVCAKYRWKVLSWPRFGPDMVNFGSKWNAGPDLGQVCRSPGGNLQSARYRASTVEGFTVLARHWTTVPCQHWNMYWFTTGITPKSVVSRHLVSGLGLYYASTAPTLGPVPTFQYRHF